MRLVADNQCSFGKRLPLIYSVTADCRSALVTSNCHLAANLGCELANPGAHPVRAPAAGESQRCRRPHAEEPRRPGPTAEANAGSFLAVQFLDEALHLAQQIRKLAAFRDRLGGVAAVFESVAIALRSALGLAAVHPAATVRHRGRLARRPGSGSGIASRAQVHGQSALHGIVP